MTTRVDVCCYIRRLNGGRLKKLKLALLPLTPDSISFSLMLAERIGAKIVAPIDPI